MHAIQRSMFLRWPIRLAMINAAVIVASARTNADEFLFNTVALSGQAVPVEGTQTVFFSTSHPELAFRSPAINNLGETAFTARYTDSVDEPAYFTGLFKNTDKLTAVLLEGSPAPSSFAGSSFYFTQGAPNINDAGQVATLAGWRDGENVYVGPVVTSAGGVDAFGYTTRPIGSIEPADDSGSISHLIPVSRHPSAPILNNSGQVAFFASQQLAGGEYTLGLAITDSHGIPNLVAKVGDTVMSGEAEATIDRFIQFSHESVVLNESGQTAFSVDASGSADDFPHGRYFGAFVATHEKLALVRESTATAPDLGPNVTFIGFFSPSLNDAGQLAYLATLEGDGIDDSNDKAIYLDDGTNIRLIAREGDAVPDFEQTAKFAVLENPMLGESGRSVFRAEWDTDGDGIADEEGLFTESHGTLELLAARGATIPGSSDSVFPQIEKVAINSLGQIAFGSRANLSSSNSSALFFSDTDRTLHTVVAAGQEFDVNPDPSVVDSRIINYINFGSSNQLVTNAGSAGGRPRALNDSGQLVFSLGFTDGSSGVFTATLAVPEPSTIALLLCSYLAVGCRVRKQGC